MIKKILIYAIILLVGSFVNFLCVNNLLRLPETCSHQSIIEKYARNIEVPMSYLQDTEYVPSETVNEFISAVNVDNGLLASLKGGTKYDESITRVLQINPYPPLNSETCDSYHMGYLSYGGTDKNNIYWQIILVSGEVDRTPSILLDGAYHLCWGDSFVDYLFILKKDLNRKPKIIDMKTGTVKEWTMPADGIVVAETNWCSFRGGTYNGFEEALYFVFPILWLMVIAIKFLLQISIRIVAFARRSKK